MAKTYQDALTEARQLLQDTEAGFYRYPDEVLLNILNRAMQEIGRLRPDAYWNSFTSEDIEIPDVTPATVNDNFVLPMQFYAAVVSFVVAWAEVLDDEFTVDNRADMLIKYFRMQVLSL